jgi:two-component system sensor histidine kinase KdpD
MLVEARALKASGVDVVVGIVDTHQRRETDAQLSDLERIPPRKLDYRGIWVEELDVAAIIARHPQVALVDELAHSNVPGSRNPKRFMDVEELLDNGIDVLTAVNVQHLETVAREAGEITGMPVREIIPKSFLQRASELEMIDVTPETLHHRLRDGSIYPAQKVDAALTHFFRHDNLSALRELALREVAQDVDQRLQLSVDRKKIPGPVGAREKVLVCVNFAERAEKLIIKAQRMSLRMKADLMVLTIADSTETDRSPGEEERIGRLQMLADGYHGQFLVEPREDRAIGEVILNVAERHNVTQVVIGQPRPGGKLRSLFTGNPITYLLRHLRYMDLRIVGWRE